METKIIMYENQETNYEVTSEGQVFNKKTKRELKGTLARNEYRSVQLTIDKKVKNFMVHRLVAEAFCEGKTNDNNIVHHKNGNKYDCRAENLEWTDAYKNSQASVPYRKKPDSVKILPVLNKDETIENKYRIIYNASNYGISTDGEVYSFKTNRVLKGSIRNGYIRHSITFNDGEVRRLSAHRLVYETYIGQINGIIDHIDGNKANNSLSNLRDISQSDNMTNAQANGHKGQKQVHEFDMNGNYIATYSSYQEAATAKDVTNAAIASASRNGRVSCNRYWSQDRNFKIPTWIPEGFTLLKDFPNYCINRKGEIFGKSKKQNLATQFLVSKKRTNVKLNKDGKSSIFCLELLMIETFLGIKADDFIHIDNNPYNLSLENLEPIKINLENHLTAG